LDEAFIMPFDWRWLHGHGNRKTSRKLFPSGTYVRALLHGRPVLDSKLGLGESMMRSDKVFEAVHTVQNRYMLCQLASKATRKFHKPNTRIQETTNEILNRIADSDRQTVLAEPVNASEAQRRAA